MRIWQASVGILLLAAGALSAQQHSYSAADIEAGGRIYQNSCGSCHGGAGDTVPGVDFSKGQFKTASTDEDLIRIIRSGVPNTSMPASPFTEAQAATVVAYLRSMTGPLTAAADASAAIPGDAARGRELFEGKGNCLSCHRVNGNGGQTGPDLSAAGAGGRGRPQGRLLVERLELALRDPSAEMAQQYRTYRVVTKDGSTITGTLLNQDTFTVQLRDTDSRLRSFSKDQLAEFGFASSPMPSFEGKLTQQEIADIVSYLVSLKGQANR